MSSTQKIFLVHRRTAATEREHRLHTVTVYWPPSASRPLYSWSCCCGYSPARTPYLIGPAADRRYTDHSGHTLPAWPPMASAVLVTP